LRGIPGTSELFGALLAPSDLQTEAVKAQCARGFDQFLIVEPVPRLLRPAVGAERLDAFVLRAPSPSLTMPLRIPFVEIALSFIGSPKGSPAHFCLPEFNDQHAACQSGVRVVDDCIQRLGCRGPFAQTSAEILAMVRNVSQLRGRTAASFRAVL
jgi:hypothetical protein